jgi:acyl-CoA thioesterase-1
MWVVEAIIFVPVAAEPVRIVAFGDSLTAGYGLNTSQAFPARLEAALKAKGHDVRIANAGVSGDTSTAGLARLDWSVPDGTQAVILELGANDMLRGVPPAVTRKSMEQIVQRLRARKIEVLVAGMRAPKNMGGEYTAAYDGIFPEIAKANGLILYPFFLDGVAANEKLNLRDGLHPTAEGVDVIVQGILPSVEKLIERVKAKDGKK